jgi:phage RecT family recombinase
MGTELAPQNFNSLPEHVVYLIAERNSEVDKALLMNKINMIIAKTPKISQMAPHIIAEAVLKAMIPDPTLQDHDDIYFVPYGNKIDVSFSHNYLQKLAYRNGAVKVINTFLIYEGDVVEFTEDGLSYKVLPFKPQGEFNGVLVDIKLANGERKYGTITKEHIEKARKASKSGNNGPWKEWYYEMAKKVALKNTLKGIDISKEFSDAISIDNEDTDFSKVKDEKPKAADSLADKMKIGSKTANDVEIYLSDAGIAFEIKDKWVIINKEVSNPESLAKISGACTVKPSPTNDSVVAVQVHEIAEFINN